MGAEIFHTLPVTVPQSQIQGCGFSGAAILHYILQTGEVSFIRCASHSIRGPGATLAVQILQTLEVATFRRFAVTDELPS